MWNYSTFINKVMSKLALIKKLLLELIDKIDAGSCNLRDEDYDNIIAQLKHVSLADEKYSKYQACKYLHISRATFDNHVRKGNISRGRKEQGFTELFWYKSDLDKLAKIE